MNNIATEMTFEIAIKELEDIVRRMESGNIELEQAINLYTRATELRNFCEDRLKEARLQVDKIIEKEGSAVSLQPMGDLAS